jgi:hypothetical protein
MNKRETFSGRWLVPACIGVMAACMPTSPQPPPERTASAVTQGTTLPESGADSSVPPNVADSPSSATGGAPDAGSRTAEPARQYRDPVEWLAARGVANPALAAGKNVYRCAEVSVGSPPEVGMLCSEAQEVSRGQGPSAVYRVLEHRKLKVVRSKKPVVVLDAIETVSQLDKEFSAHVDIVNLEVNVATDGLSVTVGEPSSEVDLGNGERRPRVTCDEARAAAAPAPDDDPVLRRWHLFDQELISRACSARGRWVWNAGRFAHAPAGP